MYEIQIKVVLHVAVAMLLGGIIGIEREFSDKPAGFRTHMIVAGASALITKLGVPLLRYFDSVQIRYDPIRLIQSIIVGISFICAGTIIRRAVSDQVEGLTTAATLLMASATGICVALNQMITAVGVTILTLVVLILFGFVDTIIKKRKSRRK